MGIETAKAGKLLYHLTKLSNMESIIQQGMLPRKNILESVLYLASLLRRE